MAASGLIGCGSGISLVLEKYRSLLAVYEKHDPPIPPHKTQDTKTHFWERSKDPEDFSDPTFRISETFQKMRLTVLLSCTIYN